MASQAFQWLGASQGIDGTPDAAIFDDDDMNDYQLLKRAFMNEKASPEILPFQEDLVSRLYMQMNQQEETLANTEESGDFELIRTMIVVELTRLRYMLRAYLRVRLQKVERYVMFCIDSPEVKVRLSPLEEAHAIEYLKLVGSHLKQTVTSKFPEAFGSVTKQASAHPASDMIPMPDLGHHVFVRVKRDLGQVQIYEDGAMHEMYRGDVYIMRYSVIRQLLQEGAVQLVYDPQLKEIIKALNNAEEPENRFIIADVAENCCLIKSEKASYVKEKVKKYADSLHFEVQKDQ
eukprot:jgi/Picsp_1/4582/NSC_01952-R1_protein